MEMDPTKHMNRMKQTLNSVERLKSNDKYKDKKKNNNWMTITLSNIALFNQEQHILNCCKCGIHSYCDLHTLLSTTQLIVWTKLKNKIKNYVIWWEIDNTGNKWCQGPSDIFQFHKYDMVIFTSFFLFLNKITFLNR